MPRNVEATKHMEKAWRPDLHVVCCLVAGIAECYYPANLTVVVCRHGLMGLRGGPRAQETKTYHTIQTT